MNVPNCDEFRIFNANLLKKIIIGPGRMNAMIGFFLAEIIPLLYFFYNHIFIILLVEFLIVNMCDTLDDHWVVIRKSVVSDLLSFRKSSREIHSWTDSSLGWWFEAVCDDKVGIFFARSMINNGSLWAVSWEMVWIIVLADSAKMILMIFFATLYLAHQKSIKISIVL